MRTALRSITVTLHVTCLVVAVIAVMVGFWQGAFVTLLCAAMTAVAFDALGQHRAEFDGNTAEVSA